MKARYLLFLIPLTACVPAKYNIQAPVYTQPFAYTQPQVIVVQPQQQYVQPQSIVKTTSSSTDGFDIAGQVVAGGSRRVYAEAKDGWNYLNSEEAKKRMAELYDKATDEGKKFLNKLRTCDCKGK